MASQVAVNDNLPPVWNLSVKCIPPTKTHQSSLRFRKTDKGMQVYKNDDPAVDWISLIAPHVPDWCPYDCPVAVDIRLTWPYRKSERAPVKAQDQWPKHTKPDLDNLTKALLDTMTRTAVWTDDSLVWSLAIAKMWGAATGLHVRVAPMDPADWYAAVD